jgi:hypothetical protein
MIFVSPVHLWQWWVKCWDSHGLCSSMTMNSNYADWSMHDFCLVGWSTMMKSQLLRFAWSLIFYGNEQQPYRLILHRSSLVHDVCLTCSSTTMTSQLLGLAWSLLFYNIEQHPCRLMLHRSSTMHDVCLVCSSMTKTSQLLGLAWSLLFYDNKQQPCRLFRAGFLSHLLCGEYCKCWTCRHWCSVLTSEIMQWVLYVLYIVIDVCN